MVEVINLKLDKEKIPELIKRHGFYPAYHMNKKYWISIVLDNIISDKELLTLVEESYNYAVGKK
jgi:predicted DNA-binding protein (MmcQ/YjbR family)